MLEPRIWMEQGGGPAKPALEGRWGELSRQGTTWPERGGLPTQSREGVGKRTEREAGQEEIGAGGGVHGGRKGCGFTPLPASINTIKVLKIRSHVEL